MEVLKNQNSTSNYPLQWRSRQSTTWRKPKASCSSSSKHRQASGRISMMVRTSMNSIKFLGKGSWESSSSSEETKMTQITSLTSSLKRTTKEERVTRSRSCESTKQALRQLWKPYSQCTLDQLLLLSMIQGRETWVLRNNREIFSLWLTMVSHSKS